MAAINLTSPIRRSRRLAFLIRDPSNADNLRIVTRNPLRKILLNVA